MARRTGEELSIYCPILRGKQFELIAVREFAQERPKNRTIHPIIEPVRNPNENSGLQRMVAALEENDFRYTIIVNPANGSLSDKHNAAEMVIEHLEESDATAERMSFGILFHSGGADVVLKAIEASTLSKAEKVLVYDGPPIGPTDVGDMLGQQVQFHVVDDKNAVRILGEDFARDPNFVKLDDPFPKRRKNTEYVGAKPSVFCRDHLFLEADGYMGLSDYLTVGSAFSDGGALPLALVIHLTYQDPETKLIYLRHFCSRSNDDQSDPGGKFLEAVAELVAFADSQELKNPALDAFRAYHEEERFPGLGMIKKLSMQNHLYVMDEALRTA